MSEQTISWWFSSYWRPCLHCQSKSGFWHILTVFRLVSGSLDSKKPHEIGFMQIRFKLHGEVVWNVIQIWFVHMRLIWTLCSIKLDISCLVHHSMDTGCWNVLTDRTGGWTAADPDKCPAAHSEICTPPLIIKCLQNDTIPSVSALWTVPNVSLHSEGSHPQNIVTLMFIGLFRSWVCLVQRSSAPLLGGTSVWTARWCIHIFPVVVVPHGKAAHQRTTDTDVDTTVTYADRSVMSGHNKSYLITFKWQCGQSVKNQFWGSDQICCLQELEFILLGLKEINKILMINHVRSIADNSVNTEALRRILSRPENHCVKLQLHRESEPRWLLESSLQSIELVKGTFWSL